MKRETIIGILLIIVGIGLYIFYDNTLKPEREAREYLVEGQIAFERGSKESINNSINIFSRVIARYPRTAAAEEAYYYIGQSYEKLGLNRLAYLKYIYILKSGNDISGKLANEIKTRIARLTILRRYTEEGINQLLGMLNHSRNRDFRSRVYSELGHAYLKMSKYKKARRMFDIAITENGNNEEAILGKARALKRVGHDNKAFDLYEYFLKYYGNYSHFSRDTRHAYLKQVFNSGIRDYKRGRYYPAISFFKRLLKYFPGVEKTENALYLIGESYYSLHKYDKANEYYNRVLNNYYHHKNQQARMKKGYSYFMAKRFDLAAREFQIYMNDFPRGKYFKTARKWNNMSAKEIMYRMKSKKSKNGNSELDYNGNGDDNDIRDNRIDEGDEEDAYKGNSRGVGINHDSDKSRKGAKYENVAEL